uniref:Leucine rich repeat transmembrane neuronal 4 n=1 Tax=Eptatretus burgeri TaxID=7764 RepID=A0A8C4PW84_EPTBU
CLLLRRQIIRGLSSVGVILTSSVLLAISSSREHCSYSHLLLCSSSTFCQLSFILSSFICFSRLRRLTWLYIDHNFVQTVSPGAFSGVHRLRELILGSNRIGDLDASTFQPLPNIRNLDLSYNRLEHLAPGLFSGLRKLQSLQLRANAIRSLPNRPFRDCRALEFLDLGYNRLRALPRTSFTGLKHLTELHVERNRVVRVDVIRLGPRLPNLRALYLKLNRIDMLSHIPPPRWTSLQVLDLSGNGIQQLKPEIMERLPNLEELKLDSNKLEVLEPDAFMSLSSLVFLSLTGNPWACDERLCGLAAWLHSFKGHHGGGMLCAGPEQLAGDNVLEALESHNLFSSPSPPSPEHDLEQMSLQKVVAGCAALILSVLVILLVVFISWRRYPASVRHLQAATSGGKRHGFGGSREAAGTGVQTTSQAAIIPLEYYVDYKTTNADFEANIWQPRCESHHELIPICHQSIAQTLPQYNNFVMKDWTNI